MRVGRLVALVAITLVLAGCSSAGHPSTAVPGATDPGTPVALSPGDAQIHTSPATMLSAAKVKGLTSMPWVLTGVDERAHTITLLEVTGDGDCIKPRGVYVRESASSVLVDVLSKTASGRSTCASMLTMASSVVTLQQPLGARKLIHAVVDGGWRSPNFFDE